MSERKAFIVTEPEENTGGVIFAASKIEARRIGAGEWNDGEIAGMSVRRAPAFDKYEGAGVPSRLLVAEGWWFECQGCDMRVEEYTLEDAGLTVDGVVGTVSGSTFCCARCEADYTARRAREKAAGEEFLAGLRSIVRRVYGPDATFDNVRDHVFAREEGEHVVIRQAIVEFRFPGQTLRPASLRYEWGHTPDCPAMGPPAPRVFCSTGDRDTFEAWATSAKGRRDAELGGRDG